MSEKPSTENQVRKYGLSKAQRFMVDILRNVVGAANNALGAYLGSVAVESWGYPEGALLEFNLQELEKNQIGVLQKPTEEAPAAPAAAEVITDPSKAKKN